MLKENEVTVAEGKLSEVVEDISGLLNNLPSASCSKLGSVRVQDEFMKCLEENTRSYNLIDRTRWKFSILVYI